MSNTHLNIDRFTHNTVKIGYNKTLEHNINIWFITDIQVTHQEIEGVINQAIRDLIRTKL